MKTKILLVDDDPNIRQLVNLYLEKEGFEVVMADRELSLDGWKALLSELLD